MNALPATAGQRRDFPRKLERHEVGDDRFRCSARSFDQRVDADRIIAHRREDRMRRRIGRRAYYLGSWVLEWLRADATPEGVRHVE